MGKKTYHNNHTVKTVLKSNRKILETEAKLVSLTHTVKPV